MACRPRFVRSDWQRRHSQRLHSHKPGSYARAVGPPQKKRRGACPAGLPPWRQKPNAQQQPDPPTWSDQHCSTQSKGKGQSQSSHKGKGNQPGKGKGYSRWGPPLQPLPQGPYQQQADSGSHHLQQLSRQPQQQPQQPQQQQQQQLQQQHQQQQQIGKLDINAILSKLHEAGVSGEVLTQVANEAGCADDADISMDDDTIDDKPADPKELARKYQSLQARLQNAEKNLASYNDLVVEAEEYLHEIKNARDEAEDKVKQLSQELADLGPKESIQKDVRDFVSEMHAIFEKGYESMTKQQFAKLSDLIGAAQSGPNRAESGATFKLGAQDSDESQADSAAAPASNFAGAAPKSRGRAASPSLPRGRDKSRSPPPRSETGLG